MTGAYACSGMNGQSIRQYLGVDTLVYNTVESMVDAAMGTVDEFCLACFTSKYPTPIPDEFKCRNNHTRHPVINTERLTL